jgi:hypothetical protein
MVVAENVRVLVIQKAELQRKEFVFPSLARLGMMP